MMTCPDMTEKMLTGMWRIKSNQVENHPDTIEKMLAGM